LKDLFNQENNKGDEDQEIKRQKALKILQQWIQELEGISKTNQDSNKNNPEK
jgi:hypothetical protein